MPRSGRFRKQQPTLADSGTSVTKPTRAWVAAGAQFKRRGTAITAGGAAMVLAAGIAFVLSSSPGGHAAPVAATSPAAASKPVKPAVALQVVSMTPAAGSHGVNGASPIRVQFSGPQAASSPMPTLSPNIVGSWHVQGNTAVFTPEAGFFEKTHVKVTVPAGSGGMLSAAGATAGRGGQLGTATTEKFTTGAFRTGRLQQVLAQLGYLPMTWNPASGTSTGRSVNAEMFAAYDPPEGSFSWQSGYPYALRSQWKAGSDNVLDVGAVRAFESVHGMTMDGVAGRAVWSKLLTAVVKGQKNPNGYTYALASKTIPETLTIWHNGHVVLHTAANTGIPSRPTDDGTFAVYLKYYFSYMKGTNPDGSKYNDPVYYASYFNGGDAVHEFARGSYGWPQSLGCVELPWDAAKKAYPYLTYGSLVTVAG